MGVHGTTRLSFGHETAGEECGLLLLDAGEDERQPADELQEEEQHAEHEEEEEHGLLGASPYALSDGEFDVLCKQYGPLCRWESKNISLKLPVRSIREDAEQRLLITLWSCGTRYKLQRFVVGAYEFFFKLFQHHPEMVPADPDLTWRIGWSLMHWRMREKLGPRHGFKVGVHDEWLAQALQCVPGPCDPRYEPAGRIAEYFEQHQNLRHLEPTQRKEVMEFVRQARGEGEVDSVLRVKLYDIIPQLSDLPPKPSRNRPFEHDEHFGPYVKRFLRNASNKFKDEVMKRDRVYHSPLSVDEYAGLLPDPQQSAVHADMVNDNQLGSLRQMVAASADRLLKLMFVEIQKPDSGVIRGGQIAKRELAKRLGVEVEDIEARLDVLKEFVVRSGGVGSVRGHHLKFFASANSGSGAYESDN